MPLRQLLTEEQERYSEIQEWACDIFTAPGSRKKRKPKPIPKFEAWPTAEQATATLAQELDAGPVRRRATHALRAGIRSALSWTSWHSVADDIPEKGKQSGDDGAGSGSRADRAAQLANAAVLVHAPTSVMRGLMAVTRESVGIWVALRSGRLGGRVALTAPTEVIRNYGRAADVLVNQRELSAWRAWLDQGSVAQEEGASALAVADIFGQGAARDGAPTLGTAPTPFGTESLRPYQQEAVDLVERASPSNCCVVLPCGAGKTKVGAALACSFLTGHPDGCVIVFCLRREGARQWAHELTNSWGIAAYAVSGASRPQTLHQARVILVTYHRMLSERRRALKVTVPSWDADGIREGVVGDSAAAGSISARFMSTPTGLLIADECHMVPAPRISELLRALLGPRRRLVGLTATLLREGGDSGGALGDEVPWPLLGHCVYRQTFAKLAPEYLAPVRCIEVSVPVLGKWRHLFAQQPLAAAVCLSQGKWVVLEHLLARHAEESLLITVERCEQARLIASTFGIIPLDGSVPAPQMKEYLERFRARKILALVATHVLDDSADFPELTVMIQIGGHFASRRQEQQRLGRLLRWGPIKKRRWEEQGTRPTFYVLVHAGTIEERMSRHRTSSVIGVQYEKLQAAQLTSPPESPLRGSDLFRAAMVTRTGTGLEENEQLDSIVCTYQAGATSATVEMEKRCYELSLRVAQTLPGNTACTANTANGVLLSDIRKWLSGVDVKMRVGKPDQQCLSSEESWDEDIGNGADNDDSSRIMLSFSSTPLKRNSKPLSAKSGAAKKYRHVGSSVHLGDEKGDFSSSASASSSSSSSYSSASSSTSTSSDCSTDGGRTAHSMGSSQEATSGSLHVKGHGVVDKNDYSESASATLRRLEVPEVVSESGSLCSTGFTLTRDINAHSNHAGTKSSKAPDPLASEVPSVPEGSSRANSHAHEEAPVERYPATQSLFRSGITGSTCTKPASPRNDSGASISFVRLQRQDVGSAHMHIELD